MPGIARASPRVELALTLPIFVGYHLAVVFLHVRNASDLVTGLLLDLSAHHLPFYLLFVLAIGTLLVFALGAHRDGPPFRLSEFLQIAVEGVLYAALMSGVTRWILGFLFAGRAPPKGPFVGLVMSLGAGFYEEITYRLLLFGFGGRVLLWLLFPEKASSRSEAHAPRIAMAAGWGLFSALVFSAAHHVGPYGDPFRAKTFVARTLLGICLTLVFRFRGFAAAVWTHTFYDVWVLVL